MKYLISISLLIVYLAGSIRSSWTLIDFYIHRDDLTMKYCRFLDQGITQCRASCYLESLLAEEEKTNPSTKILPTQITKTIEITYSEVMDLVHVDSNRKTYNERCVVLHADEHFSPVFRPPIV